MRRSIVLLLALSAVLTGGCASSGGVQTAEVDGRELGIAREHAYTRLLEIRVDDDPAVVGYLIEFDELPIGVVDERPYPVGTTLLQDVKMNTVGFITPRGQAFRFDDDGISHAEGFGKRHELIARVLIVSPNVRLRSVVETR